MSRRRTQVARSIGICFQRLQKYDDATNRVGPPMLFEVARPLSVPVSRSFEARREIIKAAVLFLCQAMSVEVSAEPKGRRLIAHSMCRADRRPGDEAELEAKQSRTDGGSTQDGPTSCHGFRAGVPRRQTPASNYQKNPTDGLTMMC